MSEKLDTIPVLSRLLNMQRNYLILQPDRFHIKNANVIIIESLDKNARLLVGKPIP